MAPAEEVAHFVVGGLRKVHVVDTHAIERLGHREADALVGGLGERPMRFPRHERRRDDHFGRRELPQGQDGGEHGGAGGHPINFLTEPFWFRQVLVGLDVWKNIGWNAIIYLAALAGVSPNLYEAAAVDGASRLQRVWHISVPAILPVIVLVTMLNIGNLLSAGFEQVFVFYNPSVYGVGDIIDTWVFRQGIEGFQYSVAAAVGLFKGVVGCALLVVAHLLA